MPQLKNSYFALRHGQSQANVQSKIVSDPEVGIRSYGLSGIGKEQVKARQGWRTYLPVSMINLK